MNFVLKNEKKREKSRNCVFKTRDIVSKTRDFVSKMMNFAGHAGQFSMKDSHFPLKSPDFLLKKEDFIIKQAVLLRPVVAGSEAAALLEEYGTERLHVCEGGRAGLPRLLGIDGSAGSL